MGTQAHTLLALLVPLCCSCCSLLKCIYCTELWVISHPEQKPGVPQECCSFPVLIFVIFAISLEVWSRFGTSPVEFILIQIELMGG